MGDVPKDGLVDDPLFPVARSHRDDRRYPVYVFAQEVLCSFVSAYAAGISINGWGPKPNILGIALMICDPPSLGRYLTHDMSS